MSTTSKLHSIRFIPLLILEILVNILAQAAHETGHHIVYQVMGHEPVWAFTKVVQLSETLPTDPDGWTEKTYSDGTANRLKVSSLPSSKTEETIMAAAGPLAGLFGNTVGRKPVNFHHSQQAVRESQNKTNG